MPRNILLSIKPKFAKLIFRDSKAMELRRHPVGKGSGTIIYVYASAPVSAVVGFFEVGEVLYEPLEVLWKMTKDEACVSWDEFKAYFSGKTHGYAYSIEYWVKLPEPKKLASIKIDKAPQSWMYLKPWQEEELVK